MSEFLREGGDGVPEILDTRLDGAPTPIRVDSRPAPVIIATPAAAPFDPRLLVSPNDLLPVSFLARGAKAARAVGRIVRRDDKGEHEPVGTGFMISEDLLLTNWHILRSVHGAAGMAIQFRYEEDGDEGRLYDLDPATFFVADRGLDYAVVSVAPLGEKVAGAVEGMVSLARDWGQARVGAWVNIVQHADGRPKSVVVRENQVVGRPGDLLLYTADTVQGSSGSPVFSDRWELVALHRRGAELTTEGRVANIGVRASSVARALRASADDGELPNAGLLRRALGMPEAAGPGGEVTTSGEVGDEGAAKELADLRDWLNRLCDIVGQQEHRPHPRSWGDIENKDEIYKVMSDYGPDGASYGRGLLLDLYTEVPDDENRGSWAHNLFHACGGTHS